LQHHLYAWSLVVSTPCFMELPKRYRTLHPWLHRSRGSNEMKPAPLGSALVYSMETFSSLAFWSNKCKQPPFIHSYYGFEKPIMNSDEELCEDRPSLKSLSIVLATPVVRSWRAQSCGSRDPGLKSRRARHTGDGDSNKLAISRLRYPLCWLTSFQL